MVMVRWRRVLSNEWRAGGFGVVDGERVEYVRYHLRRSALEGAGMEAFPHTYVSCTGCLGYFSNGICSE
jgi:hypothetical protein